VVDVAEAPLVAIVEDQRQPGPLGEPAADEEARERRAGRGERRVRPPPEETPAPPPPRPRPQHPGGPPGHPAPPARERSLDRLRERSLRTAGGRLQPVSRLPRPRAANARLRRHVLRERLVPYGNRSALDRQHRTLPPVLRQVLHELGRALDAGSADGR